MKTLSDKIAAIIEPSLQAEGFAVVKVNVVDGSKRRTVQVMIENTATGRISLDECAQLSHSISALLDVEDCLSSAYVLEVSSPGIDRPLVRREDYERYLGFEAKIETALPVQGRRRFKGPLMQATDEAVTIRVDTQDYTLAWPNINAAKLVLTDALIKAHQDGTFNKKPQSDLA